MRIPIRYSILSASLALSPLAGAATFISNMSGPWGDANTWTAAAGFPETYISDGAAIDPGHTVDYDGSINAALGGVLVVANLNVININGGSLTQSWVPGAVGPFGTAIAIGASHPASGFGDLYIDNGGIFDSGTANAVVVGVSVAALGANPGDGLLVLNDGTISMNVASSVGSPGAAGLAAGVDEFAVGLITVGDGVGAPGTATIDLATNNTLLTLGGINTTAIGGTGRMNVSSDGIVNTGSEPTNVGEDFGNGTLNILGGAFNGGLGEIRVGRNGGTGVLLTDIAGTLTTPATLAVGTGAGGNGTVNIKGASTVTVGTLSDPGQLGLRLGVGGGTGEVNITDGTLVQNGWAQIGTDAGSTGTMNIDGPNAAFEHLGYGDDFQVGLNGGTGNINVTNGGRLTNNWWLNIARGAGSTGTVNIDGVGSIIEMDPTNLVGDGPRTNIGEDGVGTMNLTNGGIFRSGLPGSENREVYIGRNAGSQGLLTVKSGSEFQANGNWAMIIGNGGTGQVDLESGGKILSNTWVALGAEVGGNGTLNIADTTVVDVGSIADDTRNEGRFAVGRLGNGLVNQSGGTVRVDNWLVMGLDPAGNGTYNLNGGTIELHQPNYGDRNIIVGNNGTGTMNITDGSIVSGIVDGTYGTDFNQFNVGADGYINADTLEEFGGTGELNINLDDPDGVIVHRELYAGWARDGSTSTQGTINVLKGTLRTDGWVEIGRGQNNAGGTGTINVNGPQAVWERGTLAPNADGDRGGRDMIFGNGEEFNTGKGYLNVSNGGTVNHNWWINLARQAGTEGHITVDGPESVINIVSSRDYGRDGNAQVNVGEAGTGSMFITNGGVFNHSLDIGGGEVWIGRNGGSSGEMIVENSGSAYNAKTREFRVAGGGEGSLNIFDGGEVTFASTRESGFPTDGNFGVSENAGSNGSINMDNGTLNVTAWSLFSAWNDVNTNATIDMTDSTININYDPATLNGDGNPVDNGGHLFWGDAGTATINQSGGLIAAQGWSAIGRERGGDAFYNMSNNAMFTVQGDLSVGRQSHGTITMETGASINLTASLLIAQEISPTTPSSGTINNNGGSLTVGGEMSVGRNGDPGNMGSYSQFDGSLDVSGPLFVGRDTAQGYMGLIGGTATVGGDFLLGVSGGGNSTIDITVNITGNATIGNTGSLSGNGTLNAASNSVLSGGNINPDQAGSLIGTLTFNPNLVMNAGSGFTVHIIGAGSSDKIASSGNIDANGSMNINLNGYAPVLGDVFDIADAAAITGTPTFDYTGAALGAGLAWDDSDFLTDGTIKVVTGTADPYDVWATGFGLTGGKADDDDNDGSSNLLEFATNSDPKNGGSGARYFGAVANVEGEDILTFTVAVRSGATFAASGMTQLATVDGIDYVIEASNDLVDWTVVEVTELAAVDAAAVQGTLTLPALDAGWEYHTFRTDGTTTSDPEDMIRLSVSVNP
jgi:T5SS/PEP-CTERM-associated repeat protein